VVYNAVGADAADNRVGQRVGIGGTFEDGAHQGAAKQGWDVLVLARCLAQQHPDRRKLGVWSFAAFIELADYTKRVVVRLESLEKPAEGSGVPITHRQA